jgi:predicted HNH restriction endonuclease
MEPIVGMRYTWGEVSANWHGEQTFLAKRDGRIVCATLVKAENPEAPEVMVVGTKPRNIQRAEEFCQQGGSIPVFIKHAVNEWEYVGVFELASYSTDRETLERHGRASGEVLTRVIFLRQVDENKEEGGSGVRDVEEGLPVTGIEGKRRWRTHLQRERDPRLVSAKKCQVRRDTGRLACEACDFDFADAFGPDLADFCEVHHLQPLAESEGDVATDLSDLAVLCANCHRAIHRLGPKMPTIAELRTIRRR